MADDKGPKPSELGVAVNKEGVEEGVFTGGIDEDTLKARLTQKFAAGSFVLNETEARALAEVLDIRKELEEADGFTFGDERVAGPDNPTAGLTPATGSGGTPFKPEAATKETKEAAKEAAKRVEKNDYDSVNDVVAANAKARDRALAASVEKYRSYSNRIRSSRRGA